MEKVPLSEGPLQAELRLPGEMAKVQSLQGYMKAQVGHLQIQRLGLGEPRETGQQDRVQGRLLRLSCLDWQPQQLPVKGAVRPRGAAQT